MEKSFGRMISVLYRKSQVYIGSALKKHNLTAAEQPFFMTLIRHDGSTQEELSSLLHIDKAATARVVKSLEDKGYVLRINDNEDRRRNRVFLTDIAKERFEDIHGELKNWNAILTKGIDAQTLDVLYGALEAMEQNVKKELNL